MQTSGPAISKGFAAAMVAVLVTAALVVAGCTALTTVGGSPAQNGVSTALVPMSITDAPSDQVVAASLTLNSVVLVDSKGNTTSVLSSPMTFEAAHLDTVQEPLFTPSIPEGTYTSVELTYSNAQVAYINSSNQLELASADLANTSQTFTFPTPLNVTGASTSLLIDYLVANSVAISGSTVTVTPEFNIAPAPVAATPTNGTNGLFTGVKGKVTALGTNQFTLTNAEGLTLNIAVNSNTQYQGLSGFGALEVGSLVEVDIELEGGGVALALRVEEQVAPNATAELLVGPVLAVTGSPATSFTQVVRQQIGPAPTATPVEKDTIAVTGSTQFQLPGRLQNLTAAGGVPFTPTFNASTLFAGQVVAVATSGVTNNQATASAVILAPQTVGGTITSGVFPTCVPCWGQITLTLPSGSWLATVTGQTTVIVMVPTGSLQALPGVPATATGDVRFNGFLFMTNGKLTLIAAVEGPPPGTAIGPVI